MKYCVEGGYCGYKFLDGAFMGCSYQMYCDFQRSLDSRVWEIEYCPACGVVKSLCPGHTDSTCTTKAT